MYKTINKYIYIYILTASFAVLCFISCDSTCDSKGFKFEGFRLSEGGYLAKSNKILIHGSHAKIPAEYGFTRMGTLIIFDIDTCNVQQTLSEEFGFLDFSWIPGQNRFITDNFNRMDLYSMDKSTQKYYGSAIECPTYMYYLVFKWNPKGTVLAMICTDIRPGDFP